MLLLIKIVSLKCNTNILILRVETYKKGNGLESFLEYLACRYFNEMGYITENQILVGFRGSNFLETGAVYAPYVPLIMTPLVYDPSDFTPRKGVMTRYAKKMIRPEFYGKIYCSDLNLI